MWYGDFAVETIFGKLKQLTATNYETARSRQSCAKEQLNYTPRCPRRRNNNYRFRDTFFFNAYSWTHYQFTHYQFTNIAL